MFGFWQFGKGGFKSAQLDARRTGRTEHLAVAWLDPRHAFPTKRASALFGIPGDGWSNGTTRCHCCSKDGGWRCRDGNERTV